MLLIGLTGGVGMGKSAVAEYLSRRGEQIIDTDALARDLVQPGAPALEEIKTAFGKTVIARDGSLNRAALAEIVFHDQEARTRLELILHPRIRAAWREWAAQRSTEGASRAVIVIPLLFETGAETELDTTVCVACSGVAQEERLRQRGWNETEITRRIAAQMPIRKKMDQAHRVIWNEATLEICELQAACIFESLG